MTVEFDYAHCFKWLIDLMWHMGITQLNHGCSRSVGTVLLGIFSFLLFLVARYFLFWGLYEILPDLANGYFGHLSSDEDVGALAITCLSFASAAISFTVFLGILVSPLVPHDNNALHSVVGLDDSTNTEIAHLPNSHGEYLKLKGSEYPLIYFKQVSPTQMRVTPANNSGQATMTVGQYLKCKHINAGAYSQTTDPKVASVTDLNVKVQADKTVASYETNHYDVTVTATKQDPRHLMIKKKKNEITYIH